MTATKCALIVDIGFGDLVASRTSAERVQASLAHHGFTKPTVLSGAQATAAGIAAALKEIGGKLEAGDAFVFYFVGHGEVVRDPSCAKAALGLEPAVSDVFVLITHDVLDSTAKLAGIPGIKLLEWLTPIAKVTDNVTVILDCCHATGVIPRQAVDGSPGVRVQKSLDQAMKLLRDLYAPHRSTRETGVRGIVCVLATTRNEGAVEVDSFDGSGVIGLFSAALADSLLEESAAAWSWDDHIVRIQGAVLARCATQRPGVEGPRYRRPFSTSIREPRDSHACGYDEHGVFTLRAGLVHGVAVGDTFEVVRTSGRSPRLAVARVQGVDVARASLDYAAKRSGLRAVPLRRRHSVAVRLNVSDAPSALIRGRVTEGMGITFDGPEAEAVAILDQDERASTLRGLSGDIIHVDEPIRAGLVVDRLVDVLARVAHLERIERGLRELGVEGVPRSEVTWGCADRELTAGETLSQRDSIWVRVDPISHGKLFVAVFHIRGDREVVDLLPDLDSGWEVKRGGMNELTRTAAGERAPWSLGRGPGVWDGRVVREAIVLVVSPRPISLHGFATPKVTRGGARRGEAKMVTPAVVRLEFLLAPDEG